MEAKIKIICGGLAVAISLAVAPFSDAFAATPVMRNGAMNYERSDDEFAAAIVVDAASGKRLYGYQTQKVWPAASLTKLMSAMVVLDYHQPWSKVVATAKQDEVGGGSLVVKVGSKMKVQDMFYASIVGSANNTTMSLARLSGLGVSGFVKKMNAKAKALGLKNTAFVEPTGLDEKNVTTAEEMAKLAQKAFTFPMIRRAAATMSYKFTVTNPKVFKTVRNTNQLLTLDDEVWVIGGKTGFIYEARYNLAVQMRPMAGGPQLVVVVLGSPTKKDSFASAKSLAKWAWRAYAW